MPLTEDEQRRLQEIGRALYEDDPKFARRIRAGDPQMRYERKLLQVAVKIAVEPWAVNDEVLGSLRAHGLTDDDIWDVGSISAFFAMSNRLARLTSTMPNEEFYLLGRLPPTPSALPVTTAVLAAPPLLCHTPAGLAHG